MSGLTRSTWPAPPSRASRRHGAGRKIARWNGLPPDEVPASETADAGWAYWRPAEGGGVELGTVWGCEVGLPAHFHDEAQATFVVAGRRRFLIGDEVIALSAGQGALIPAGVVHRSLAEPAGVVCINAYVPAGDYDVAAMMADAERRWRDTGHLRPTDLAAVICEHRQGTRRGSVAGVAPIRADRRERVAEAAARAGLSREGFSRIFARHHGLPPHAFWLLARLNHARGLLRSGESIAAAVEAGFADQSHFGR